MASTTKQSLLYTLLHFFFPFLKWMKGYNLSTLKIDANAGFTVALVLVPQSMANAQLAGLPAYHGLYAALLPALVGGIWGSSRQMVTGSVAIVCLMASTALAPLGVGGVAGYIAYMALLALLVGVVQLALGICRMGIVVNFLSLPVISGFTNAAAIIIASSQLAKFFGVVVDAEEYQYQTVGKVLASIWNYSHYPSVCMGLLALGIMFGAKRYAPKAPAVLLAVIITTLLSWLINFEQTYTAPISSIANPETKVLLTRLSKQEKELAATHAEILRLQDEIAENPSAKLDVQYRIDEQLLFQEHIKRNMSLVKEHLRETLFVSEEKQDNLRVFTVKQSPNLVPNSLTAKSSVPFSFIPLRPTAAANATAAGAGANGTVPMAASNATGILMATNATMLGHNATAEEQPEAYTVYETALPAKSFTDGKTWRLRLNNAGINVNALTFTSGGEVVGAIPASLPDFTLPEFSLSKWLKLLPSALIIAFIGFAEAISIGKATANRGGYRLDANQELVGQGLANIAAGFSLTTPVSGSLSNSAVNIAAGAKTGISCVFASLGTLIVLLFFTGALAYVPQPVLAAIILRAVVGLFNFGEFKRVWTAQWFDGIIALVTFFATLYFAPHLDYAILLGVILSLMAFFYRAMNPVITALSVGEDKVLRDVKAFNLTECRHIAIVHFQGPLFFANSHVLEEHVQKRLEIQTELRHIHLVCSGITHLDASGEDALQNIVTQAEKKGVSISFSGVVGSVADVLRRTGIMEHVGTKNMYVTPREAVCSMLKQIQHDAGCTVCPLSNIFCRNQ